MGVMPPIPQFCLLFYDVGDPRIVELHDLGVLGQLRGENKARPALKYCMSHMNPLKSTGGLLIVVYVVPVVQALEALDVCVLLALSTGLSSLG